MDSEDEGFDNLNNIRLKGDPILDEERFKKNIEFENLVKSIKDFYYLCEQLRLIFVPNFYSPTDYQKIEMDKVSKGTLLVKKRIKKK